MISIYFVHIILVNPYIGINVKTVNNQVFIHTVDSKSWAERQKLHSGDIVEQIDGHAPMNKRSVRNGGFIDDAATIVIRHGLHRTEYKIDNNPSVSETFFSLLFPVTFFFICFGIGCLLYRRIRKDRYISVLILFLAVIGPIFLNIWVNLRIYNWTRYLVACLMSFSIVLFLHFLKEYFNALSFFFTSRYLVFLLYLGSILTVLNRIFVAKYPIELIFVPSVFLILVFLILRLFFKTKNTAIHQSVQVLLTGSFLALFPFAGLFAIPDTLFNEAIISGEWTLPFIILLPLTLLYLVLSSAFVDISFFINRLAYFSLFSLLLTAVFLTGLMGLTSEQFQLLDVIRLGIFIFTGLLIVFYIKENIEYRFRKQLYPRRRDFQMSLNRFLKWMRPGYKLSDLAFIMRREMENSLPVKKVEVVKIHHDQKIKTVLTDQKNKDLSLCDYPPLGNPGIFQTNKNGFSVRLFENNDESIALIGKWNSQHPRLLNIDEKIWVETIVDNAQIIVENLSRADELADLICSPEDQMPEIMRKAMFKISERERKQLSQDLHDTTIQEQLALARDVDQARKEKSNPEFIHLLSQIRERILENVAMTRQVIHSLHPEFIYHTGLSTALNDLCDQIRKRAAFSLYVVIDFHHPIFDRDLEINMYRIVQELLNNAIKHAQAEHVTLIFSEEKDYYKLIYDDDGIGIDKNKLTRSFSTMGLPGLIERVQSTEGKIAMDTVVDNCQKKGLHVEITWPI